MQKEFTISRNKAFLNFTAKYCDTREQVLNSEGFRRLLDTYLDSIKARNTNEYYFLNRAFNDGTKEEISESLVSLMRLLGSLTSPEISELTDKYDGALKETDSMNDLLEDIYNFWRRLERYSIIKNNSFSQGHSSLEFINANVKFTNLILKIYREIKFNITAKYEIVYRQLPSGTNAGIIIQDMDLPDLGEGYSELKGIPFISSVVLEAPFITYPSRTTRKGIFTETDKNPITGSRLTKSHYYCYPVKVGELLAYIYFHRDLMSHGITLCNLFEMAPVSECRGKKPDLIYVYGGRNENLSDNSFWYDKNNDIMVGFVPRSEDIDYFGYLKKMALTLHNLVMIRKKKLPIHGAMVRIRLTNGKEANVCIMGDSGAGKSESLEALRGLSQDHISDMTIIFDDMGSFELRDDGIYGYGTETGAFVRLDDLDQGYAFKEMDRSIFMNPDKTNARLVMPVTSYKEIIKGYKVDIFLYANNYTAPDKDKGEKPIRLFTSEEKDEAMEIFIRGRRFAKGTTQEKGISESFFANPFGPVQKKEETTELIKEYFAELFRKGVRTGEIYTQLGVEGMEKDGPREAAMELFSLISE